MSWFDPYEREEEHLATPSEAVAEYGRNAGAMFPDRAWLLHDWDVWVKNPHYVGPPVKHPEEAYSEMMEGSEAPGFDDPSRADEWKSGGAAEMDDNPDDDVPF